MFSADSKGIVIIWNSYINPQVDTKRKRKGTGGKNRSTHLKIILSTLPEYQDSQQSFIIFNMQYCNLAVNLSHFVVDSCRFTCRASFFKIELLVSSLLKKYYIVQNV